MDGCRSPSSNLERYDLLRPVRFPNSSNVHLRSARKDRIRTPRSAISVRTMSSISVGMLYYDTLLPESQ